MFEDKIYEQQDVEKAARLIYFGLEKRKNLQLTREYKELLSEFHNNSHFRGLTNAIASGLYLEILSVDASGIYLNPQPNSVFALKSSSVNKLLDKGHDRYIGLILLAIAAFYFPTDVSFDQESSYHTAPISVHELNNFIHKKCVEIKEKVKPSDVTAGDDELELLLTSYLQLPNETTINDKSRSTKEYFIRKTFRFLIEQGLFFEKDEQYWPTHKFRLQMDAMVSNELIKKLVGLQED
ncbi:MAG: DUF6063 family protein [Candidatus Heimdallarchaeaceae archaeon]